MIFLCLFGWTVPVKKATQSTTFAVVMCCVVLCCAALRRAVLYCVLCCAVLAVVMWCACHSFRKDHFVIRARLVIRHQPTQTGLTGWVVFRVSIRKRIACGSQLCPTQYGRSYSACCTVLYCALLCCALCCVVLCSVLCCAVRCGAVRCGAVRCGVLCSAVLCCTVRCCAVLCAVLCCAVRCCVVLCCAVQCYAVLCCAVQCCALCSVVANRDPPLFFPCLSPCRCPSLDLYRGHVFVCHGPSFHCGHGHDLFETRGHASWNANRKINCRFVKQPK